jgi:DNA-binding NtrC family response regulator
VGASSQLERLAVTTRQDCEVIPAGTVLVVDDEAPIVEGFSRVLARGGFEVLAATGPHEALHIFTKDQTIDVVLSDVSMPEMKGTELIREIAHISPQTASILMTGGFVDSTELPSGVPVLRKPLATVDLLSAVNGALIRSRQWRANKQCNREISVELQTHSEQLRSEAQHVVQDSSQLVRESRAAESERSEKMIRTGF